MLYAKVGKHSRRRIGALTQQRRNDPEDKKARILASARELFIAHGFEGTSMSAVAAHSGVTQSMIHHYFGSKQGLWEAVKTQAFDVYLASQQALLEEPQTDVDAFIRSALSGRFSFFEENPDMVRFLSWIQLSQDPLGMETGQETGRLVIERIARLQEEGQIRDDIAAEHVLAMALALTTYWYQSKHLIQFISGAKDAQPETADAAYEEAAIKLFKDGLTRPTQ
jgi:TetR/AcrR family transcriptional regulator